jgi:hypothetical protein
MAKLTVDSRPRDEVKLITRARSSQMQNPVIPTGDHRHLSKIRDGAQSAEVWSREQREIWHEEFDGPLPANFKETLRAVKEVGKNADQKLSQRGKKSVQPNAKAVRGKKGPQRVLRAGQQEGEGQEHEREGEKRVQKTKERKRAQKKVSN